MKRVLIIAELGINANGDIELAKKLIDGAKTAGADVVKFQKRTVDRVYTQEELEKFRESPWGTMNRDQKEGLEFNEEEYWQIDKYCKEIGIPWFASPWDLESEQFLGKFDCPFSKVASARLGHRELLESIAKRGRHTFISTGMSSMEEVMEALLIFRTYDCSFELMHCNSAYPAKEEELNLLMIPTLRNRFNCNVGYSCHSPSIMFAPVAVALGATSIEKHITLDRSMYGSDQAASVEVHGFQKLVDYVRSAEKALGDGVKRIYPSEEACRKKLWKPYDIIDDDSFGRGESRK